MDDVQKTLARWEEDERRVRGSLAPSGVASVASVAGKSGLDILRAISAGELPAPPFGDISDIWPIEFDHGRFTFQGRPSSRFLNPLGTIHGGWIATLLDSAVGCAIHTTLPAGKSYGTAELKVSYVRPLTSSVGLVRAVGEVLNTGSRAAFAQAHLRGPDGKLYAHATTTCVLFDLK